MEHQLRSSDGGVLQPFSEAWHYRVCGPRRGRVLPLFMMENAMAKRFQFWTGPNAVFLVLEGSTMAVSGSFKSVGFSALGVKSIDPIFGTASNSNKPKSTGSTTQLVFFCPSAELHGSCVAQGLLRSRTTSSLPLAGFAH